VEPSGGQPAREGRADSLAARLEGALDEELSIVPARRTDAAAPEDEPAGPVDVDEPEAAGGASAPRVSPARERDDGPARRPAGADLAVAPARERPVARVRRRQDVEKARHVRRRSKSGSLALTTLAALVLMVSVGGAAWYADTRGLADLGIVRNPLPVTLSMPRIDMTVSAADGWVEVPSGSGTVVVSADGPYRVRLDGVVYSLDGGRRLRVPMEPQTQLSVRAVREPTVARVSDVP
jgi:hypothetical protein